MRSFFIFALLILLIDRSNGDPCQDSLLQRCQFSHNNFGADIAVTCGHHAISYTFQNGFTAHFRADECTPFIDRCYCQCQSPSFLDDPSATALAIVRYLYQDDPQVPITAACMANDIAETSYTDGLFVDENGNPCRMHGYAAIFPRAAFQSDCVTPFPASSVCNNHGTANWVAISTQDGTQITGLYQAQLKTGNPGLCFDIDNRNTGTLATYVVQQLGINPAFISTCQCLPVYKDDFCGTLNCAGFCNRHTTCSVNQCNQIICQCSGRGVIISFIDHTGQSVQKCLCDDGFAGLNCEYTIPSINCANGQVKGIFSGSDWMRTSNGLIRPSCNSSASLSCDSYRGFTLCGGQCVCSSRYLSYDPSTDWCIPRTGIIPSQDLANCIL